MFKFLFFFLIICLPLFASEPISKDEVLKVAEVTKLKIESIQTYKFLLVKREWADGRDTGYQYLQVKVRTEPLQIYVKFLKPKKYAGREALFKDGEITVRRGGTRLSDLVVSILPDSPLAMEGNRYPITFINPKVLANELMKKIEHELSFEETELIVFRQAEVFEQSGTHYRLIHTKQKRGMSCYVAEIMISNETGLPIYFRSIDFQKHLIEEYAFKDMVFNIEFDDIEFDEKNPEYGFNNEKD